MPLNLDDTPILEAFVKEDECAYMGVQSDGTHWSVIGNLDIDDYVHETTGIVAVFGSSGKVMADLGRFIVKQVDVDSAVIEGDSVFDIFDLSASTIGYFEDLYDYRTATFKDSVLRALDCEHQYVPSSLLIIDRLELAPAYRGLGAGLDAMKMLISRFRVGAGMVAVKPFPLQFEGGAGDEPEAFKRRGFDRYAGSELACTRRLARHYGKLGFVKIPRTPYMCLPMIRRLGW
jgi:hypothetical protein